MILSLHFQINFHSPAPVASQQLLVAGQIEVVAEEAEITLDKGCVAYVSKELRRYLLLENAYPTIFEWDEMVEEIYGSWLEHKLQAITPCPRKEKKNVSFTFYFMSDSSKQVPLTKLLFQKFGKLATNFRGNVLKQQKNHEQEIFGVNQNTMTGKYQAFIDTSFTLIRTYLCCI